MTSETGCVVVGIEADKIETLLEQVSLSKLLDALVGLDPITYVHIEKNSAVKEIKPEVHLIDTGDRSIAESRIRIGADTLVVGLDARIYIRRVRALWREFAVFSSVLVGLGTFFPGFCIDINNCMSHGCGSWTGNLPVSGRMPPWGSQPRRSLTKSETR